MTINIGPTFVDELRAAGLLELPFSWGTDGSLSFGPSMTDEQRGQVQAVLAAHDPAKVRPEDERARRLAAGMTITCASNAALNAAYAIDDAARANVVAVATSIAIGLGLPLGADTIAYQDLAGVPHEFTADEFKAFAAAMRDYYYSLGRTAEALRAGISAPWPAATVAIA